MSETAQEYIKRITGHVEGKQPLEVQAATPQKLQRLIEGIPKSRWDQKPALDKWSKKEILAHLADTEIVAGFRIRMILGAPGTPIPAYDQNSWVTSRHYEKRDPRESVKLFRVSQCKPGAASFTDPRAVETPRNAFRARKRDR